MRTARADAPRVAARRWRGGCVFALLACVASASATDAAREPLTLAMLDDFPELTRSLAAPRAQDGSDPPEATTCASLRALRADEVAAPWTGRIRRIDYQCRDIDDLDADMPTFETTVRASLDADAATLAGLPVIAIRRVDAYLWGDHQFVIDAPFAANEGRLRAFVQTQCDAARERGKIVSECVVERDSGHDGIYMTTSELGGVWIHPDPDDAARTIYAEAWTD